MRVSRVAIVNTLCCAIGALLATNATIIYPYRYELYQLWMEAIRCIAAVSL